MNKNIELEYNIVYIRPLVEHDFVIWSPFTVKDIEAIESVQRRFTKRLVVLHTMNTFKTYKHT